MDKLKIKEINKRLSKGNMSKGELLALRVEIANELTERQMDSLIKLQKRINHAIYECRDCADAKFKYTHKDGDEKELFIADCGKEDCTYAEYLETQADRASDIDLMLKKMLE